MKKYIFSKFEFSSSYKKKLIKIVKNMCNLEMGGERFYDGMGNHYMQNPKEIIDLIFFLKKYEKNNKFKIKSFLEIGFANGVNSTFLNKVFQFTNMVAIDNVSTAGTGLNTFYNNLRFKELTFICGNSKKLTNIKKASILGPYDFIFIDGGHDYETVKSDFKNYSKFLSSKGILAFHDIKSNIVKGVPKFWKELKENKKSDFVFNEFFDKGQFMECGIGTIIKKNNL